MLIQIPDPDKREYYELEAVNEGWTGRQLERQRQLFMLQQENNKEEWTMEESKQIIVKNEGTAFLCYFSSDRWEP